MDALPKAFYLEETSQGGILIFDMENVLGKHIKETFYTSCFLTMPTN
jgi:hypothetical protein